DRARLELERLLLLMEDRDTQDVSREQVARELDSPKGAAQGPGKTVGQRGLPHSGHVLDEEMPPRQQGHRRHLDHRGLALDDPFDVASQGLDLVACVHRLASLTEPPEGVNFPEKSGLTSSKLTPIMQSIHAVHPTLRPSVTLPELHDP